MHDEEAFQRQKSLERKPAEPRIEDLRAANSHDLDELAAMDEEQQRRRLAELENQQLLDDVTVEQRLQEQSLNDPVSTASKPSVAAQHTKLALNAVSSSDYSSECKHCGAKPFSRGPHHKSSCARHRTALALHTDLAHRYSCQHCDAQPFVAGAHHTRDCPRRIKKHVKRSVTGPYGYSKTCKHCGVTPFSQGPHHESECKRNWDYAAYATALAHRYECAQCGAKPFVAGPHHQKSCKRHFY